MYTAEDKKICLWLAARLSKGCRLQHSLRNEAKEDGINETILCKVAGMMGIRSSPAGWRSDVKGLRQHWWNLPPPPKISNGEETKQHIYKG